jgi:hypothetical protein
MTRSSRALIASAFALAFGTAANAGPAAVVAARGKCSAKGICAFEVTVQHADEGWSHYADRWEVVGPDGQVLATRVLQHPHVDEQPFTRTLTAVAIPASVERVTIRARDSVHGFGGAEKTIELVR